VGGPKKLQIANPLIADKESIRGNSNYRTNSLTTDVTSVNADKTGKFDPKMHKIMAPLPFK
jgi:hypothetical protein